MGKIPDHIQRQLQEHLIQIAKIFRAPRITLIVRSPEEGNAKGDLVLGNDLPVYVEKALKARIIDEARILIGTPQEMRVVEKEKTDGGLGPHFDDGGPAENYQPRRRQGE